MMKSKIRTPDFQKNRESPFAETLPYKTANFFHCVQIAPLFERIQPNTSHKTEAGVEFEVNRSLLPEGKPQQRNADPQIKMRQ